jgi:hypothetical protein
MYTFYITRMYLFYILCNKILELKITLDLVINNRNETLNKN